MKLAFRFLISLLILGLVTWVIKGGNDLGERAGLLQGIIAFILLWVTWTSVDRSDKQIEVSQKQTDAIIKGDRDHLLYVFSDDSFNIQAVNLGKYPILIIHAWFPPQYIADVPRPQKNLIIMPGETQSLIDLIDKMDFIQRFDREAGEFLSGERDANKQEKPIIFEVRYIYGGTGSNIYTKVYEMFPYIGNEFYAITGKSWRLELQLRDFMYEIKGLQDSHNIHIPIYRESEIVLPDDQVSQDLARYSNRDVRSYSLK